MAQYRSALPQLGEGLFLTDGGIETTLIFHDGLAELNRAAFARSRRFASSYQAARTPVVIGLPVQYHEALASR